MDYRSWFKSILLCVLIPSIASPHLQAAGVLPVAVGTRVRLAIQSPVLESGVHNQHAHEVIHFGLCFRAEGINYLRIEASEWIATLGRNPLHVDLLHIWLIEATSIRQVFGEFVEQRCRDERVGLLKMIRAGDFP
jgi:hypothetical protein